MKIPKKIIKGDEIRVIAPSDSASIISDERVKFAEKRFKTLGFSVTYGKNIFINDVLDLKNISAKVQDLHEAFQDKKVKAVFSMIGGLSSGQLLKHVDWNIIKNNPKIFCGYSDIDTLSLAIRAKTNMVTYSGVHFSTFSQMNHFEYTLDHFLKCVVDSGEFEIKPSPFWSDDKWYIDQNDRKLIKNDGWWVINLGAAEGEILGCNTSSIIFLKGTEYLPSLKDKILFLEKDVSFGDKTLLEFDAFLESVTKMQGVDQLRGVVIGRFQVGCKITKEDLMSIVRSKKQLNKIPVLANVDFGHTDPKIVLPIGGTASLLATKKVSQLKILKH